MMSHRHTIHGDGLLGAIVLEKVDGAVKVVAHVLLGKGLIVGLALEAQASVGENLEQLAQQAAVLEVLREIDDLLSVLGEEEVGPCHIRLCPERKRRKEEERRRKKEEANTN